jgi:hypothetical protein
MQQQKQHSSLFSLWISICFILPIGNLGTKPKVP